MLQTITGHVRRAIDDYNIELSNVFDRIEYGKVSIRLFNNEIGYTKENCVSCCEFCNKAKRNITIDEFYNKCYKIVNKKIELDEKYFNIAKERIESDK